MINLRSISFLFQTVLLLSLGLYVQSGAWADTVDNCQLSVSRDHFDYGSLRNGHVIDSQRDLSFGTRLAFLTINCVKPTTITVFLRSPQELGNKIAFGKKGHISVHVKNAQLEGNPVLLGPVMTEGQMPALQTWTADLEPGQGFTVMNGRRPAQGKSFSAQLEIEINLPEQETHVTEMTKLKSSFSAFYS